MLSNKLVKMLLALAIAEREDSFNTVAGLAIVWEDSTLTKGLSLLAPAKAEGRCKDKELLTRVKEFKINQQMGDHQS